MNYRSFLEDLARFDPDIASATGVDAVWQGLRTLSAEVAGHRLFTVMTVDMEAVLARRAFTDQPGAAVASVTPGSNTFLPSMLYLRQAPCASSAMR